MDSAASGLKPIECWTSDDVLALPNGEFDWLDYKESRFFAGDWKSDLSKFVSAWANYAGGFLVIGVRDPAPGRLLEFDEGIDLAAYKRLGEQLDSVIPRLVEPPITHFRTHIIAHPNGNARGIAIIHIPASDDAPHQATDRKYYVRRGRHRDPLGHRAIEDIRGRQRFPKIRAELTFTRWGEDVVVLAWRIHNESPDFVRHVMTDIRFPTMMGNLFIGFEGEPDLESDEEGSYWNIRIANTGGSPLFPGGDMSRTFKATLGIHYGYLAPSIKDVRMRTFADAMPVMEEKLPLPSILRRA